MPTKAGNIVINIRAGTSKLQSDLNGASNAFKQFGSHGVSSVQATSGALRVLEGNLTNNLRASERFIANVIGLGPVLQKAFPLIGGLAFAGLLVELGERLHRFFQEVQEAPEKNTEAFRKLTESLQATDAELKVSNAQLDNELAKLSGKPGDGLKVALLEAAEAAAKLQENLGASLKSLFDMAKTFEGPWYKKFENWVTSRGNLDMSKAIGGLTGFGEANEKIQESMDAGIQRLQALAAANEKIKDSKEKAKALAESQTEQEQLGIGIARQYADLIAKANQQKAEFIKKQQGYDVKTPDEVKLRNENAPDVTHVAGVNETENLEKANRVVLGLTQLRQVAEDKIKNALLTQEVAIAKIANENAKLGKPFESMLAKLDAELADVEAKLKAVGLGETAQAMAAAYGKAREEMAALNKELGNAPKIKEGDARFNQLLAKDQAIALKESELKWQEAYQKGTAAIHDRIKALELEAAAVGGTYAQRREAFIASRLPQAVGPERFNDPKWMADPEHQKQVASTAAMLGKESDTQEYGKASATLQQLTDKIHLTLTLAAAERESAEAVHQAELAEKIRIATRGLDAEAAAKLTAALTKEDEATDLLKSEKELAVMREQAVAMDRLANAYGHKARVQAEAQNAYDKAINADKSPEVAQAEKAAVLQKDQDEIISKANEAATAYADQLETIQRTEDALKNIAKIHGDTTQIETALRDLEKQRLEIEIQMDLKQNDLKSGLEAFFLEMQRQAETTAQIIYNALTAAIDKTSDNLAKMLTEKAPKGGWGKEFGKEFQEIGHQLVASSIKASLQHALGDLGKKFGIGVKRDGSSPDAALYVDVVNKDGQNQPTNAVPHPLDHIGGRVFGGGDQGGGVFSALERFFKGAEATQKTLQPGVLTTGGAEAAAPTPHVTSIIHYPTISEPAPDLSGAVPASSLPSGSETAAAPVAPESADSGLAAQNLRSIVSKIAGVFNFGFGQKPATGTTPAVHNVSSSVYYPAAPTTTEPRENASAADLAQLLQPAQPAQRLGLPPTAAEETQENVGDKVFDTKPDGTPEKPFYAITTPSRLTGPAHAPIPHTSDSSLQHVGGFMSRLAGVFGVQAHPKPPSITVNPATPDVHSSVSYPGVESGGSVNAEPAEVQQGIPQSTHTNTDRQQTSSSQTIQHVVSRIASVFGVSVPAQTATPAASRESIGSIDRTIQSPTGENGAAATPDVQSSVSYPSGPAQTTPGASPQAGNWLSSLAKVLGANSSPVITDHWGGPAASSYDYQNWGAPGTHQVGKETPSYTYQRDASGLILRTPASPIGADGTSPSPPDSTTGRLPIPGLDAGGDSAGVSSPEDSVAASLRSLSKLLQAGVQADMRANVGKPPAGPDAGSAYGLSGGKPDGTPGNPFYVVLEQSLQASRQQQPQNSAGQKLQQVGGIISSIAGALGAGGGGGMSGGGSIGGDLTPDVSSSISFPGMADGGDVSSGMSYLVGDRADHQPEIFTPRTDGHITPLDKMGGGDTYHVYNIDATGSQIGVETRIEEMLKRTHEAAVTTTLRAVHEQKFRTPQKGKG